MNHHHESEVSFLFHTFSVLIFYCLQQNLHENHSNNSETPLTASPIILKKSSLANSYQTFDRKINSKETFTLPVDMSQEKNDCEYIQQIESPKPNLTLLKPKIKDDSVLSSSGFNLSNLSKSYSWKSSISNFCNCSSMKKQYRRFCCRMKIIVKHNSFESFIIFMVLLSSVALVS